jgi:hypothetical protein
MAFLQEVSPVVSATVAPAQAVVDGASAQVALGPATGIDAAPSQPVVHGATTVDGGGVQVAPVAAVAGAYAAPVSTPSPALLQDIAALERMERHLSLLKAVSSDCTLTSAPIRNRFASYTSNLRQYVCSARAVCNHY